MSSREAENLCAAVDSLIVGLQMALNDARAMTGDDQRLSQLVFKLRYARGQLFEVKSELMDFGVNSIATPRMPPEDPEPEPAKVPA